MVHGSVETQAVGPKIYLGELEGREKELCALGVRKDGIHLEAFRASSVGIRRVRGER